MAFERLARQKEMPQSYDQILHKTQVFLAGFRSILANEGRPVRLDQVPEDWECPVDLPNQPADQTAALFRKKFGSAEPRR